MQIVLHSAERADAAARIQRLLRRKRSEKLRLEREIEEVSRAVAAMMESVAAIEALQQEVSALFAKAMQRDGLSAREVRAVRDVHEQLLAGGLLWSPQRVDDDDEPCGCPVCSADGPSEPVGDEQDPTSAWEEPLPVASAHKAPREPGLRALYRDLALRFHPDRAADDASRAHHEAMMREVNAAYHGGDTERLLRLSQELGVDVDRLRSADGVLADLVRQYEQLKEEVRWLRSSPPGQIVLETRRARRRREPTPIEQMQRMRDESRAQLERVRDFVAGFVAGKLTVAQFLAGPDATGAAVPEEDDEDDIDDLELLDFFESVVVTLAETAFGSGGPPSRRRRSRGRRRKNRRW
jgi:hypothetical protein